MLGIHKYVLLFLIVRLDPSILARVVGVLVGRYSGGQLSTTIVAIINIIIFSSFFLFFSFVATFSHRRSARIKKLIYKVA